LEIKEKKPIHVLQVMGSTNRGGTEIGIINALKQLNRERERVHMDFLVHADHPGYFDNEVRKFGGEVIPCHTPSRPWKYARNFKRILREFGPYNVVHSHIHYFSGFVLRLAHQCGVPIRIAHSRFDMSKIESKGRFYRRWYVNLMKKWITRHATLGLAVSRSAAGDLFGQNWESDPRWRLLYLGIDLSQYGVAINSHTVRRELGVPRDALVVGHVGRFAEQKNHAFLVKIAAEIAKRNQEVYFVLAGEGPLRPTMESEVRQMGLSNRVIFAGLRSDVPRLMKGAFDVLLFPSLYEGLPSVVLEAQAAGIPSIISDNFTEECVVIKPLVRRLCLTDPPAAWAEAVMAFCEKRPAISPTQALAIMEKSPFNNLKGANYLYKVYGGNPI
jgi:glycosyltransferase involved in cell wall biosynthesis